MRRPGFFGIIYLIVGLLVAGGVIGSEPNLFDGIGSLTDVIELVLVVLLWPLVLLGVNIDISGGSGGSGGGGSGGGSGGSG
ncbi:hypothetical protein HJD18_11880 [Thermoleophilia bacterium SCSIO 60948]|nr:hypothetical protein HJD18_11880 [Thermoleophilia bacterium SCSIO 60948]